MSHGSRGRGVCDRLNPSVDKTGERLNESNTGRRRSRSHTRSLFKSKVNSHELRVAVDPEVIVYSLKEELRRNVSRRGEVKEKGTHLLRG